MSPFHKYLNVGMQCQLSLQFLSLLPAGTTKSIPKHIPILNPLWKMELFPRCLVWKQSSGKFLSSVKHNQGGEIPENSLLFHNSQVQQMESQFGFQDLRGQNQQNRFCAPVKCWIFSMAEACQQGRFRSVWNLGWTIPKDVKVGRVHPMAPSSPWVPGYSAAGYKSDCASFREFQPKLRKSPLHPMESLGKVLWSH